MRRPGARDPAREQAPSVSAKARLKNLRRRSRLPLNLFVPAASKEHTPRRGALLRPGLSYPLSPGAAWLPLSSPSLTLQTFRLRKRQETMG